MPPRFSFAPQATGTALVLLLSATLLIQAPTAATSTIPTLKLNPNTASAAELQLLPRMGPTLAGHVIAHRQQRPFRDLFELEDVPRIGPTTRVALTPWLDLPAHKEVP